MAKKIEILENTLLKLLVRRGDDADRQNITLSEGELGYTTDSKRLYIGDGSTQGGVITGNKFLGSVADHTSLVGGAVGDIAYNTTNNILYVKTATDWNKIAQIFVAANDSIIVNDTLGTISVGTLSSQHLSGSNELTGNSIELVSGQISLSSTQIKSNRITAFNTSHLHLPQKLNINNVDYSFPTGGLGGANSFLNVDSLGNLKWASPQSTTTVFFNSSSSAVPVGTVVQTVTGTSMPTGWLLCNGQQLAGTDYRVLSGVIGAQYGGNDTNFNLPNYASTVLYGVNSNPAGGTVYHLGTGTSSVSAKAVNFFIKALPDAVSTSNVTVTNGLTASSNGSNVTNTAFSLLNNDIEIGLPMPGLVAYDTAGSGTYTTKATYTKFWVTGSGATGGSVAGGAAATIYGILSAPIGTSVSYTVGAGRTTARTNGQPSYISIGGTELARSIGAIAPAQDSWADGLTANNGSFLPNDPHVVSVHILSGAWGGMDTSSGDEEVNGNPSFWGGAGSPGASNHSVGGSYEATAPGIVKFEWGM
jgi:microcystin-dependent protein